MKVLLSVAVGLVALVPQVKWPRVMMQTEMVLFAVVVSALQHHPETACLVVCSVVHFVVGHSVVAADAAVGIGDDWAASIAGEANGPALRPSSCC